MPRRVRGEVNRSSSSMEELQRNDAAEGSLKAFQRVESSQMMRESK